MNGTGIQSPPSMLTCTSGYWAFARIGDPGESDSAIGGLLMAEDRGFDACDRRPATSRALPRSRLRQRFGEFDALDPLGHFVAVTVRARSSGQGSRVRAGAARRPSRRRAAFAPVVERQHGRVAVGGVDAGETRSGIDGRVRSSSACSGTPRQTASPISGRSLLIPAQAMAQRNVCAGRARRSS